jgi:hypothetical protein
MLGSDHRENGTIIARCLAAYRSHNPDVLTMAAAVGSQLKQDGRERLLRATQAIGGRSAPNTPRGAEIFNASKERQLRIS